MSLQLDAAERLIGRRRFLEAWETIESLDANARISPRALRVRLQCCCGLARWEMGRALADLLAAGDPEDRVIAAGYYHALAVAQLQDGDREDARESIKKAISAWEIARLPILEDRRLEGLW